METTKDTCLTFRIEHVENGFIAECGGRRTVARDRNDLAVLIGKSFVTGLLSADKDEWSFEIRKL